MTTEHTQAQSDAQPSEVRSDVLLGTLDYDKVPAHACYGSGNCCGIFNVVRDGELVCNECGMTIMQLLDEVSNARLEPARRKL